MKVFSCSPSLHNFVEMFLHRDWGGRNFFPLVHTEAQHDPKNCWIIHMPDKAALGHSSTSAQLHPVLTISLFWISDLHGVCLMKIGVVLVVGP